LTDQVSRKGLSDLDPDALDAARAAARELGRRFLARTSRRMRRTRRGRIDVRRTIRRAVSRGGALIHLERRGRRPGRPGRVVLCDVSGSVAHASELLLTILAAAEGAFANVTRIVFVDHVVPADFADGRIPPEGQLDMYGFPDLGTVLVELERASDLAVDRRTVLLVLGDARNNRRPARADALRRLAQRSRAVVRAVPEPRARWNTGDSVLASYAPSVVHAGHRGDVARRPARRAARVGRVGCRRRNWATRRHGGNDDTAPSFRGGHARVVYPTVAHSRLFTPSVG
jgi:uncharacterized protein with von Willebrand factor type A (vWA) domain